MQNLIQVQSLGMQQQMMPNNTALGMHMGAGMLDNRMQQQSLDFNYHNSEMKG